MDRESLGQNLERGDGTEQDELFRQVVPSENIEPQDVKYEQKRRDNVLAFPKSHSNQVESAPIEPVRELSDREKVTELNKLISGGGDPFESASFLSQVNDTNDEYKQAA